MLGENAIPTVPTIASHWVVAGVVVMMGRVTVAGGLVGGSGVGGVGWLIEGVNVGGGVGWLVAGTLINTQSETTAPGVNNEVLHPMLLNEFDWIVAWAGTLPDRRLVHPPKDSNPMVVTESGMLMMGRLVQPKKA
jgi:hypothetical protein